MKTLCDYELSRLAKEAGFDEKCNDFYIDGELLYSQNAFTNSEEEFYGDPVTPAVTAPQLNDLQGWLLEVKGVWVELTLIIPNEITPDPWMVEVKRSSTREILYRGYFQEKDQALSEGIKSYLKSKEV